MIRRASFNSSTGAKLTLQIIWHYWDMLYIFSLITCLYMGMMPKMRGVVRTWDGSNGWSTNSIKHRVNKGIQYFHRTFLMVLETSIRSGTCRRSLKTGCLWKHFLSDEGIYLSHANVARDTVPFEWLRWKVKKLNLSFQQFNMFILFIW